MCFSIYEFIVKERSQLMSLSKINQFNSNRLKEKSKLAINWELFDSKQFKLKSRNLLQNY